MCWLAAIVKGLFLPSVRAQRWPGHQGSIPHHVISPCCFTMLFDMQV